MAETETPVVDEETPDETGLPREQEETDEPEAEPGSEPQADASDDDDAEVSDAADAVGASDESDDESEDEDEDPPVEVKGAGGGKPPALEKPRPKRPRDPVRGVALVLACAAAAWAGFASWSWYDRANDEDLRFAELRDQVRQSGEQAIVNLNTLDYRTVGPDLKVWRDSSTGAQYDHVVRGGAEFEQQVTELKTVSKAKVLELAVSELDEHAGKARVIVAIQITVIDGEGKTVVKLRRQVAELTRTSAGWKVSALEEAPVGSSGS
ncbi:hypothetical protein [Thermomonospora umbrina]|uniref:Mce-associated membrane protein n=1 Tax=Thermomonospora umbrina TaxID=111806 RepID=A0A3D9SXT4_9ACTN|nr:hypothetical protein [Thermomonospora umbrina]REE97815.1 hypothetical protein DFJ69_3290 [Thermomonospora umbrina]